MSDDDTLDAALEAYDSVYDAEYMLTGVCTDNRREALRRALSGVVSERDEARAMYNRLALAAAFCIPAKNALDALGKDRGEPFGDNEEIGRIDDSRGSPSFRFRARHVRGLFEALNAGQGVGL